MSKEAYYFSHDSNARHDPNILAMRSVYGMEGYGWYWVIIEMLREQEDYKLEINKYIWNALAMQTQCDADAMHKFVEDCINEFNLFDSDGDFFWSSSLRRRMEFKDEKSEKAKKAANARWEKHRNNKGSIQTQSGSNADAMQTQCDRNAIKERKRKEIKENKYTAEFESFWDVYPRKIDKAKAFKSFKTQRKKHSLETIIDGTKRYADYLHKSGTEQRFIKHGSTFLNNESFLDKYEEQNRAAPTYMPPSQRIVGREDMPF